MCTKLKQLQELDDLFSNCKGTFDKILTEFGWSEEETVKSFNKTKDLEERSDGVDLFLPESFTCKHSVTLDDEKIKEICRANKQVPRKFSDIQLNFTREEKLKLYEYAIEATGRFSEPELDVSFLEVKKGDQRLSFAEIVAIKKAEKKKRRKYRTTKPTHIEEVRSLVDLQMQAYKQWLKPDLEDEGDREARKRHRRRDHSNERRGLREKDEVSGRDRDDYKHRRRKYDESGSRKRSPNSENLKPANPNRHYRIDFDRKEAGSDRYRRSPRRDDRKQSREPRNVSRSPSRYHKKSKKRSRSRSSRHKQESRHKNDKNSQK